MTVLQESFSQLKAAQGRFMVSLNGLEIMKPGNEGKEVMIPMTSTLYVSGSLASVEKVLVDIGTGYFVEKNIADAADYYKRKIEFIKGQLEKLQGTIVAKRSQMGLFMDIFQMRMSRMAEAQASAANSTAASTAIKA